jgi:hypothetical protein
LALWHNYKWATLKIIEVFGSDFIAPLFHHVFPDRNIDIKKMSLSTATTLLSYIRLAYPSIKQSLSEAMGNDQMTRRSFVMLQNMWHLFEFFIPVVI